MRFKTAALGVVLLGGATAGGVHFKAWDRLAPAWLQEKTGMGLRGSPDLVARAMAPDAGPVGDKIRDVTLGKTVRWRLRVASVEKRLLASRESAVTYGGKGVKVIVSFTDSNDL